MEKSNKCSYKLGEKNFDKKKYKTPEEAIQSASKLSNDPSKMHTFAAYKCETCHFFHVGRTNKLKESWDDLL
jgi:hypothetical protein